MHRHIEYRELPTTDGALWVSDPQLVGFAFTELVPSWAGRTAPGSRLDIDCRIGDSQRWSRWYPLAQWSTDPDTATSVPDQSDALGHADTDTVIVAAGVEATRWQLRVNAVGDATLDRVGAMVSSVPRGEPVPLGEPGPGLGRELAIAGLSQRVHGDWYAQWDGGGGSWCSPTSTSMVLAFWGAAPSPDEYEWVRPDHPDRHVVHAVRGCFDRAYGGAGNWPFNTAYAATRGMHAFITRLRSLTEAERFIAAGIPLVASVRVDPAVLPEAGYAANGHLVVIGGFSSEGDIVCFDPASPDNDSVRRVYRRANFAAAWGASGGIVYVIHPPNIARPAYTDAAEPNW